jgi:DNA-binding IclR family transcriptional regulator
VTLTARVVELLERRTRPITAALVAFEVDATPTATAAVLLDLVRLGIVKREKPAGAYRYELVRL